MRTVCVQLDSCAIRSVCNRVGMEWSLSAIGSAIDSACNVVCPIASVSDRVRVRLGNTAMSDNMRNRDTPDFDQD